MSSEKEVIFQEDLNYIKLLKNTKGYNWEIKIFEGKGTAALEQLTKDIEHINEIMKQKFGASEE